MPILDRLKPTEKLKVAVYDPADYKIREIKQYPIASNGRQIKIQSGGDGHFMPTFDNDSYLDFPKKKRLQKFRKKSYDRVYITPKLATACVNFKIPNVTGIDLLAWKNEVMNASKAEILKGIGSDEKKTTPLWVYGVLLLQLMIFGLLIRITGVM